jgi:tRNA G18 (ribose-2'-O)-methylase SpoU
VTTFIFCQCLADECRFRYPVAADDPARQRCPRCGSPASPVADALSGQRLASASGQPFHLAALLDNIRSVHNIGSIFRTADGAGLEHLYLCGITATPGHPRLSKAALGAQETVSWSYSRNAVDTASALQAQGYSLWALERLAADDSRKNIHLLFDIETRNALGEKPAVLVVGNERAGVDPGILALCDHILSLPMHGQKPSLNAAVAFGIAVYYLRYVDERHEDKRGIYE